MVVFLIANMVFMAANIITFFLILDKKRRDKEEIERERQVLDYIERKRKGEK